MNSRPTDDLGGTVERGLKAMRDLEVPEGPSEELIAESLGRLGAGAGGLEVSTTMKGWWTVKKVKFAVGLAMAAGLILVASVLIGILGQSRVVFADVIDKVKAAPCVSFKTTGKALLPEGAASDIKGKVWIAQDGRSRMEAMPSGQITIQDATGKSLLLIPVTHEAIIIEATNAQGRENGADFLKLIKSLDAKSAVPLGAKEVAGRKTEGFKVTKPESEIAVWVDVATRMPVQVELAAKGGVLPEASITGTDFEWNAQIDPQLLSLMPPEGYTVGKPGIVADQTTLLQALRVAAEFNGGRYPDTFDMVGLSAVMGKSVEQNRWAPNSPEFMDAWNLMNRGWMFTHDSKNGEDWWYAGKGVEAGKAGVPILWYRPKGSDKYCVIDADLKVHEVGPGELSKGGTPMGNTKADHGTR
jgi:outer membrane lipoprotein-sorting protein